MEFDSVLRRYDYARNGRGTWEALWQEIADRVLPQAADFNVLRADGERRTELMFDATAALASQKAVAAVSSFFWPSNQQYQKISTSNEDLNKSHAVQLWCDAVTKRLFRARYSTKAAFEAQMGEAAMQFFVFGTGLLFVDDDMKVRTLRYKSLPLANTCVLEGQGGMVDTVFRWWRWSLRQIEQRWPGKLPEAYRSKLERNPDEMVEVAHCVMPRTDYQPDRPDFKGWPWASVYFLPGAKHMLDEGGFRTWPFAVMRYMTVPGEVYGRSPAWLALSNIKVLNAQKKTILAAGQKIVDPPLLLPEDGALQAFSLAPGALNYGGVSDQGQQLVHPLVTNARLDIGLDMMDKEREIISSAFLMDVFRVLVENPQMTATQTLELMQERAVMMSPIGGRIESEGLGPMTERELDLLAHAGQLPEMPPEMVEAQGEYRIEYTSPMRKAMRASEGIAITRTFEAVLPLAQADASALDGFDIPAAARELAEINGVPPSILIDLEQVKAKQAARQEQAQLAQLVEAAPAVSSAAANLTKMQANAGRPVI